MILITGVHEEVPMDFLALKAKHGFAKALALCSEAGENIDHYLNHLTFVGWLDVYLASSESSVLEAKALTSLIDFEPTDFQLWLGVFLSARERQSLKQIAFKRLAKIVATPAEAEILLSAVVLYYPEVNDLDFKRIQYRFLLKRA